MFVTELLRVVIWTIFSTVIGVPDVMSLASGAAMFSRQAATFRAPLHCYDRSKLCFETTSSSTSKDPTMESTSNFPSSTNGSANSGSRSDLVGVSGHAAVDKAGDIARPILDRVAGGAHQAVDSVGSVARSIQGSTSAAHEKIDSATDAARPAVDRILTGAHQAVDKLSGFAAVAADSVSEKSAQIKEAHAKLMANGRTQVREKPAMAIGIAVAAGFILGRLLRAR